MIPSEASSSTVLFSVAAVAQRLGCSKPHVYRLIAAGELEAIDIATPGATMTKTRISERNLHDYLTRVTT